MSKYDELYDLQQKAIVVSAIPDYELRHKGGKHIEHLCRNLDYEYWILGGLDVEAEIRLRTILKIVFEYILHDAIEDEDWIPAMPKQDLSELL